jgi:hypothetical protein
VLQQRTSAAIQREEGGATGSAPPADGTTFTLTVTPQISWAITALSIRPVAEEDTWACLGGAPEYDKPRILMNYFIGYRGNFAFAQIAAQQPPGVDRGIYLQSVFQYLWSQVRGGFMAAIADRMRRNAGFRAKVERAATEGCARAPFLERGGQAAV